MGTTNLKPDIILSEKELPLTLERMASEILETHPEQPIAFVGIHTRGVTLANRLVANLQSRRNRIEQGSIDISLYRDDLDNLDALPNIKGSDIPFDMDGATVILCDDVLYTGRTIRAAINVLLDYGRPEKIQLAVLADRGHRELPIAADFVGVKVETLKDDYLRVHLQENDESDSVIHYIREEDG